MLTAAASALAAFGQSTMSQQIGISVDVTGDGFGCCEQIAGDSSSGHFSPFLQNGAVANVHIAGGAYSDGGGTGGWTFTFVLPNGDMAVFNDANSGLEGNTAIGTATLTFGSGIFLVAQGSFSYNLSCTSGCDSNVGEPVAFTFSLTGGGTLTFPDGLSLPGQPPSAPQPTVQCDPPPGTTCNHDSGDNFVFKYVRALIGHAVPSAKAAASDTGSIQITTETLPYAVNYAASANCADAVDPCWISASANGSLAAFGSATVNVAINIPTLEAGVYPAEVTVVETPTDTSIAPVNVKVPMSLVVTAPSPALTLSTTGAQLQSVAGSTTSVTQSVSVSNPGTDALAFQAAASTLSGGNWLAVAPDSSSVTTTPANVIISANPTGLVAGTYFGRVDFSASGAADSPQSVLVTLTVSPAPTTAASARLDITPAALLFNATPLLAPPSQVIQLSSAFAGTLTVNPQVAYLQGSNWLKISSSAPNLLSGHPMTQTVSANPSGLAPGVYRALLSENVVENMSTYLVAIDLVVASGTPGSCTPTQLVPVLTSLGNHFQATTGLPVTLQALISDDCGSPVNSGSVSAYFANDPPASMTALGNGIWQGTWLPRQLAGGTSSVEINAATFTPALQGSQTVVGTLAANSAMTTISPGGVVNAASFAAASPLAPGSYISVFGSNLAGDKPSSGAVPLPLSLGATSVLLNGQALPMVYAGNKQTNAVIPYDAPVNTSAQLIVKNGNTYSIQEDILLAPAQPAIFSADGSGKGAGAIIVVKPDGTQFLATPDTPASAGDAVVIFCTGLGAVDTVIAPGAASPSSPLAHTVTPATVTIGGLAAKVFFSGLTPGFYGLYQVNAIVPSGVETGPSVPVSIAVGVAASPALTLAIE